MVVLGYGLWNRRYSADPSIVGRGILINGQGYEVVGVMPPGFALPTDFKNPEPSQLWVAAPDGSERRPITAATGCSPRRGSQPGATVAQAADELHGIARAMTAEGLYPVQMQFDTVDAVADR